MTANGKAVQVTEHGVTRDSGPKFVGSGLTGAISRATASASGSDSLHSLAYEHPDHLDKSGELADEKPKSLLVPNARCPVCNAVVFYYCNSSGSSVYFDEVGKPWPKHPCTDLAYVQNRTGETIEPAVRNRAADVYEDFYGRKTVILRIAERIQDGHVTDFTLVDPITPGNSLIWGTQDHAPIKSIDVGQIVHVQGDYLTCLDRTHCVPRFYFGVFRRLSASANIRRSSTK